MTWIWTSARRIEIASGSYGDPTRQVVVANNPLIGFERFRKGLVIRPRIGGQPNLMPRTFSAALSPVGRSLPLTNPATVENRVTEDSIRSEILASILK